MSRPITDLGRSGVNRRAYYARHRDRLRPEAATRSAAAYHADPERHRADNRTRKLWRDHGLTVAERAEILTAQAGLCAACGDPLKHGGHQDHDHVTGLRRAILCPNCNLALGLLKDSPQRLRALIDYLGRFA